MILIVDDDETTRSALCDVLGETGFEVTSQPDAEAALQFLRTHPQTELVLLDLMMPGVNGYEFRRRQLADPVIAGVPILVFTAQTTVDEGLAGAHVLCKPAGLAALLAAINRATASR